MVSILLGFKQIWSIIVCVSKCSETRAVLISVLTLLLLGTFFFTFYEKMTILDAIYFCVVTLMTIGFGDLTPVTSLGKIFTIIYSFLGVGIVGVMVGIFAREFLSMHEKQPMEANSLDEDCDRNMKNGLKK